LKEELLAQWIYCLALGYKDFNYRDRLRYDPLLAVLVGKDDPTGETTVDHWLARAR